ncbi:MAG: hypothetical protein JNL66_00525 [Alphaproteobacteria bacterium]|nr:hypothetical protein [Alphaproteobacteria bacterium]
MSWLIALAGAAVDLAAALLAAVGGMYGTGYGGEYGRPGMIAVGVAAWLVALAGIVCAVLVLRAAGRDAPPGRILAIAALPPFGCVLLAGLATLLESLGVRMS